jgi:hypothetical protein
LKRDGIAYSDARMKANILNNQFTSVFTSDDPLQPLPDLGPIPHPAVSGITITQEGVHKLLCHLNPHKAPIPDQVSPRLLKGTAKPKIKNVIENVRYLCFRSTKNSL